MFNKQSFSQRPKFCCSPAQVVHDIEAVQHDVIEKNKLYFCLDHKPQHEQKITKIEQFLKSSSDLQLCNSELKELVDNLDQSCEHLNNQIAMLRSRIESNQV